MKIGPGVSELWGVENRPLPLTRPMAYTTACTTVQAVMRDDQKVLQFSMMYKWHRHNNYIIFQCNLHVHQYTSDNFVKKFFYSSQIEFLGHVVEIRLHGLLQLIISEKL